MRNEAEEAIKTIEQHLQRLRGEFEMMSTERGINVEELEEKVNR